jgi:RHH-type transcriptional regulator, rel operon repressor / antitoxin RelB
MLAIRLPEKIEKRLERLAKQTGRTKTYYAREAILRHLDDLEDVYLAERALTDIRSGRSKTVPLEDVMRQYGLKTEVNGKSRATRRQAQKSR